MKRIMALTIAAVMRISLSVCNAEAAKDGKLQLFYDANEHILCICTYNQDFIAVYNISLNAKVRIVKC